MTASNRSDVDLDNFLQEARTTFRYLEQGEAWKPNGRSAVHIRDMDDRWRYNASRWLERRAKAFAQGYVWGLVQVPGPTAEMASDMFAAGVDEETEFAERDPVAWIRTTPLYRSLVAGLPEKTKLWRLAQRAKHWSACPAAERSAAACTCPTGNPEMCRGCYAAGEQCDGCSAADDATWD